MSRPFKPVRNNKKKDGKEAKVDKSQKQIFNFFQSNNTSQSREPLSIATPERINLSRSSSILSKTANQNSGFDELGSSDTSFGSPEVSNFRNPMLMRSFQGDMKTTKTSLHGNFIDLTDKDEEINQSEVQVIFQSQLGSPQAKTQVKRSHVDLLDHITGQPKKVAKLQRSTSRPPSTASSTSSVELTHEQSTVIQYVVDEKLNVFYTGSAGTGKSVVLRELVQRLQRKFGTNRVGVTASTGLAACNIGGQTLHKYLSIGLGTGSPLELAKKIKRNGSQLKKWLDFKVLIIDEVSMIDGKLFTKLEELARLLRKNTKPFGGIQVVCTGDFFQLPPVNKDGAIEFCFQSPAWKKVIAKTVLLKQVFRQRGDNELIDMLNALRYGELSDDMTAKFYQLSRKVEYSDGLEPTELFPTRDEVKRANQARLNQLNTKSMRFTAKDNVTDPYLIKMLDNLMCEKDLELKEGAQVIYLKNYNDYIVNGSIGTVICFMTDALWTKVKELYGFIDCSDPQIVEELRFLASRISRSEWDSVDSMRLEKIPSERKSRFTELSHVASKETTANLLPIVNFKTTNDEDYVLKVDQEEFSIDSGRLAKGAQGDSAPDKVTRSQFPLLLSWALSIHKAQGQTIDRLRVDLRKIFEKGQVYVALSRATNKDHLEVKNFNPSRITTSKHVKDFYRSLEIASEESSY
ncbi:uncharacterized protein PRCAT00006346001 [Priceomyces carsonii]|uniref:uncharacterized protein n=1 Tax=Priceomyces carsonii TaxID=28549 RepID=UPI002EDA14B4|nr:unnamed protein product [Priceomyces carsonii]